MLFHKMWSNLILLCFILLFNSFIGFIHGGIDSKVCRERTLGDGIIDVEGICTQTGMACQNCSLAVTCVELPVGWLKVPLQHCPQGETCNEQEGKCSTNFSGKCLIAGAAQNYKFTCEQVGIFPDPYNCRKFHLCSPSELKPHGRPTDHRTAVCPPNYGYDPLTSQCSVPLVRGQCTSSPIPPCSTIGQTGALSTSPHHYYVCLLKNRVLSPQIFSCPHGGQYQDGLCRSKQELENKSSVNEHQKLTTKDDVRIVSVTTITPLTTVKELMTTVMDNTSSTAGASSVTTTSENPSTAKIGASPPTTTEALYYYDYS